MRRSWMWWVERIEVQGGCQQLGLGRAELGYVPRSAARPSAEIKRAGHTPKRPGHCAKRDWGVCPDELDTPYQ